MSDRVVSLNGGPTGERVVSEDVVALCERLLEMAHSGELVGLGVACQHFDRTSSYALSGMIGGHGLAGAASCLAADLVEVARG